MPWRFQDWTHACTHPGDSHGADGWLPPAPAPAQPPAGAPPRPPTDRPRTRPRERRPRPPEWSSFGADAAFTRYSPLDQIDHGNVGELEIAWRRPADDPELRAAFPDLSVNAYLRSTPILVDGVLYAPNALGLLEAFDPATGETVWRQSPFAATEQEVAGSSTRGAAYWTDGTARRLLLVRGGYLYALDAATGRRVASFGLADQGRADLDWEHELAGEFDWTGGPIVVGDVVVVAGITGGAGDGGVVREAAPENVRGFDVRTGELLWTFHVVPREGELGADTWGDGSAAYSGDLGSWCCLAADEELGLVYIPLSAPTGMVYGGHRPGDNLFSDTLVALDAATGERVWHFQMVHHDVWEYDTVGPPTLGEITVDGRRIQAVMQPSKTAFLYVFDRETGEPVWPIEERPVPQSVVPGERTSPTQPFPTKPPPFDRQGVTVDDLIDFTPELRAAALEAVERLVLGPLFTPPWPRNDDVGGKLGTLAVPGGWGAGNWHTGAFDPETGIYYAVSHTMPTVWSVAPPDTEDATLAWAVPRGEELRVPTPAPARAPDHEAALRSHHRPRPQPRRAGVDGAERRRTPQPPAAARPRPPAARHPQPPGAARHRQPALPRRGERRRHRHPARRRRPRRPRAGPVLALGPEVPRLRQGHRRRGLGDRAAGRHDRGPHDLPARGPAVTSWSRSASGTRSRSGWPSRCRNAAPSTAVEPCRRAPN